MTWPGWHEPMVLGMGEAKAIGLAHAIVLGIAVVRYAVVPRLHRRPEARRERPR